MNITNRLSMICASVTLALFVFVSSVFADAPVPKTPAPDATPSPADRAYDDMQALNQEFRQMAKQKLKAPYQVIINTAKTTALYHLRWAPSFAALSIRSDVVNGDVFTVTAVGTNWLQVVDPDTGLTGYLTKSITQPW